MLDQFFLTYRSAKVKKQIFQNAVFFSCQGNQGSVGIGLSFDGIEFDPATFQTDILLYKFSSRQTADPRLQLLQMERLFHIIICPGIESFYFVCNLSSCR